MTSPTESFARQRVQVSFIISSRWDSIDGQELILENFCLFIPLGDINVGLKDFFTMKMPAALIWSYTESQFQREHFFMFLSFFAFLPQGEIPGFRMLLAFKTELSESGFPYYLFEFLQQLTSKSSAGSKSCNITPRCFFALVALTLIRQ